jgi:cytochrome c-type biogenesis protein CcmE
VAKRLTALLPSRRRARAGRHRRLLGHDTQRSVKVTYTGILPDLFREEQGVITEGAFGQDEVFIADSVLAKHDERCMPKDVADGLKAKGVWNESASK